MGLRDECVRIATVGTWGKSYVSVLSDVFCVAEFVAMTGLSWSNFDRSSS